MARALITNTARSMLTPHRVQNLPCKQHSHERHRHWPLRGPSLPLLNIQSAIVALRGRLSSSKLKKVFTERLLPYMHEGLSLKWREKYWDKLDPTVRKLNARNTPADEKGPCHSQGERRLNGRRPSDGRWDWRTKNATGEGCMGYGGMQRPMIHCIFKATATHKVSVLPWIRSS